MRSKHFLWIVVFSSIVILACKIRAPRLDGMYIYQTRTIAYNLETGEQFDVPSASIVRFFEENQCAMMHIGVHPDSLDQDRIARWFNINNKKEHPERFFIYETRNDSIFFFDSMEDTSPTSFSGKIYKDSIVFKVEKLLEGHDLQYGFDSIQVHQFYPLQK